MATVRLDTKTEAALMRLAARRGQTRSEVIRDAIERLDEDDESLSALDRLRPFAGIADSGGEQLSEQTGKRLRQVLEEKHARRSG